jgi:hypothetical protein
MLQLLLFHLSYILSRLLIHKIFGCKHTSNHKMGSSYSSYRDNDYSSSSYGSSSSYNYGSGYRSSGSSTTHSHSLGIVIAIIVLVVIGCVVLAGIATLLLSVVKHCVRRSKAKRSGQNDVEKGTEMQPPAYDGEKTTASVEVRGLPQQPAPAYFV